MCLGKYLRQSIKFSHRTEDIGGAKQGHVWSGSDFRAPATHTHTRTHTLKQIALSHSELKCLHTELCRLQAYMLHCALLRVLTKSGFQSSPPPPPTFPTLRHRHEGGSLQELCLRTAPSKRLALPPPATQPPTHSHTRTDTHAQPIRPVNMWRVDKKARSGDIPAALNKVVAEPLRAKSCRGSDTLYWMSWLDVIQLYFSNILKCLFKCAPVIKEKGKKRRKP